MVTVVEVLAAFLEVRQELLGQEGPADEGQGAFRRVIKDVKRLYGHLPASQLGPATKRSYYAESAKAAAASIATSLHMKSAA